jgi:hypothetical protein
MLALGALAGVVYVQRDSASERCVALRSASLCCTEHSPRCVWLGLCFAEAALGALLYSTLEEMGEMGLMLLIPLIEEERVRDAIWRSDPELKRMMAMVQVIASSVFPAQPSRLRLTGRCVVAETGPGFGFCRHDSAEVPAVRYAACSLPQRPCRCD